MTDIANPIPTQRDADVPAIVEAYFAGWNAHDGASVAAAVRTSYVDPTLPGPVSGAELAGYVDVLCAAFPNLTFVPVATHVAGDVVTAEWRMQGTNDGAALPGAPAPTGATIDFPGADVITVRDGQVDTVVGYFDQKLFLEQLGFQAIPAPVDEWPVEFGLAARVDLGNTTTPGAISFTWIELNDQAELGELNDRTTEIITAFASDPAFIGFQSTSIGDRNVTLTAWTTPEAAEAAIARNARHTAARNRVFADKFGLRGFTSLWRPYRLNPQFCVCSSCRETVPLTDGATTATCSCGTEVSAAPYI
jgi:LSD1 subclass zinc finger protein